jgi:arylsulfatase A-like enzyme
MWHGRLARVLFEKDLGEAPMPRRNSNCIFQRGRTMNQSCLERWIGSCVLLLICLFCAPAHAQTTQEAQRPPNVVIFFMDDMGYADIGCYDGKTPTPNIDQLAKEGIRFTDFYAAQPVCSASRASLITGCYPNRVGISGALGPDSGIGLSDKELTLPQMLKNHGYATGMVGKWHLGCEPEFMPNRRGFDEFFGIPYSGDMWPYHPTYHLFPALPLYDNEKVIIASVQPADQEKLSSEYVEHSLAFIEKNKDRPFFLYFADNFPHVPLFAGAAFKGKTGLGCIRMSSVKLTGAWGR